MRNRLDRARRMAPAILGVITLAAVAALLLTDALPLRFSVRCHDCLAAFSLAMIAAAYLAYQLALRPAPPELLKAALLAAAFLFWSANQVWPVAHQAVVFNDVAVALFVFDIFLVIVGWPPSAPDRSCAEASSSNEHC